MSLFSPRKTSCCLIDLRLAISLGSNKDCSTTSATYPAGSLGWRHHQEEELHLTLFVGPKQGLQLGGQPFSLLRWLTSSALYGAVWPSFGARSQREVGFCHPPPPLSLYPPSSFFGRLDKLGGARWVEEWEAWSEEL